MIQANQNKEASLIKLTSDNYYSSQADFDYWSFSIFKEFMKCEASGLYKLKEHEPPEHPPMPLLVGNYVHSYFESPEAHGKWLQDERWNVFKAKKATQKDIKSGREVVEGKALSDEMYSEFQKADAMIKVLESDSFIMAGYEGEKEVIVQGELYGQPWRGKIDCLNLDEGYFVDLKTSADLHRRVWSPRYGGWTTWLLDYGYVMQMAIYQQLIEQTYGKLLQPFIFAVSKQDPPDHQAIRIDPGRFQFELETIKASLPRFQAIKMGEIKPIRCETCEYCRSTKKLDGFIEVDDLLRD